MKNSKGITLIALIITIVVLIILSGVAISTVQESNIIKKAQEATKTYKEKEDEEKAILEGYMSMLEGNALDAEPETASIVGTYGNTTASQPEYYVFKEDGTGEYVHYEYSPSGERTDKFIYTLDSNGKGTLTWEDNEVEEFEYNVIKDDKGKIVNTMLCIQEYNEYIGDGKTLTFYDLIYTTNGSNGLDSGNGTYEPIDSWGEGDTAVASVTINNDTITYTAANGAQRSESGYNFLKHNNIIYVYDEEDGLYTSNFIIMENNKIYGISS